MWHNRLTWLAGLIVAVGAAVLTAHGLIEVALASRVPKRFGWLYPVITDGLALVAYAASSQLAGAGRRYAWSVVILAAGLSGLAQAVYLAGGLDQAAAGLRFVIGVWPAIAAAIAAHLLYLIGQSARSAHGCVQLVGSAAASTEPARPPALDRVPAEANGHSRALPDVARALPQGAPPAPEHPAAERAADVDPPEPDTDPAEEPAGVAVSRGGPMRMALAPIDRARMTADLHRRRTGDWPSVRELQEQAEVGRGTAHTALKELRDATSDRCGTDRLHLVGDPTDPETDADPSAPVTDPRRSR